MDYGYLGLWQEIKFHSSTKPLPFICIFVIQGNSHLIKVAIISRLKLIDHANLEKRLLLEDLSTKKIQVRSIDSVVKERDVSKRFPI